jgi:hypothetical protein
MQTVIFGISGTNALQSRMTSGVQACCCSGVPCAEAGAGAKPTAPTKPRATAAATNQNVEIFLRRAFFINEPVPCLGVDCKQSPAQA